MPHHPDETCRNVCGVHEIYCCGSRVRISQEGSRAVTEPAIKSCPLHEAMYGTKKIDSEMMSVWLEKRLIDCAVVVCDGAGTVITSNDKLVQGIGARLTGIIKTSPIPETIEHIETCGAVVLDRANARIDQLDGVKRAFSMGFKHIAVRVAGFQARAISRIRDFENTVDEDVLVFSVCNTRVVEKDVKHIAKADLVCASASTILRNEIGRNALLQVGVTIPVYALTQRGKDLALAYLSTFRDKLIAFRTSRLPYEPRDRGPKLRDF
jgi:putative methanogenesis marker protein 8